jgi:hypothetical protein
MSDSFVIPSPIWIVCHRDRGPSSVPRTTLTDGRVLVCLFTDEDLARRYLEVANAPPEFVPQAIDDPAFAALLELVESEDKVTHVAFDADQNRPSRWGVPIADMRQALDRRLRGTDS